MEEKKLNGKNGQTSHYKKRFLENYRELCLIGKAAQATGIHRHTVTLWREKDREFASGFNSAQQDVIETLEAEAIRRAHDGWDEPVFYKGYNVGRIRKYSDTLLIFLLKGAAPEKYRERHEYSGPDGGPIVIKEIRYENA